MFLAVLVGQVYRLTEISRIIWFSILLNFASRENVISQDEKRIDVFFTILEEIIEIGGYFSK